jgi:hypothetical protein
MEKSWLEVRVGNKAFKKKVRSSTFGGWFASQTNVSFYFKHRSTSVKVSALLPRGTFTEGANPPKTSLPVVTTLQVSFSNVEHVMCSTDRRWEGWKEKR